MRSKHFVGEIYAGHTTDCGVLVPFDPSAAWPRAEQLPIGYRRLVGFAVRGSVAGEPFDSWIFHYHRRWRLVVPNAALAAARLGPGDRAQLLVRPHPNPEAAAKFVPGPKRQ